MDAELLDPSVAADRAGVLVRAAELDDLEGFHTTMQDPSVVPTTMQIPIRSMEKRRERWMQSLRAPLEHMLLAQAPDGKIVGNLGLTQMSGSRASHTAHIGMSVLGSWQGRGVGTALMAAAVDLADNWLQVRRLDLEVFPDNPGAIRLYEKFGFQHEGRRREAAFRDGAYVDSLVMGRLRP